MTSKLLFVITPEKADRKECKCAYIETIGCEKVCSKNMLVTIPPSLRRIFANAHTYHINSISVNSDGETYLSADDLR